MSTTTHHVVILGAGYAGMSAAGARFVRGWVTAVGTR